MLHYVYYSDIHDTFSILVNCFFSHTPCYLRQLSNWLLDDFPRVHICLLPHTIVPNNYLCLSIEYIYHHITQGYLTLTVCVFVRKRSTLLFLSGQFMHDLACLPFDWFALSHLFEDT